MVGNETPSLATMMGVVRAWLMRQLGRWEVLLALVVVFDFSLNVRLSPYFLDLYTLSDASFNFTEKALVALPMALLIIAGQIDLSVAAIMALISVVMGLLAEADASLITVVGCGIIAGALAGAINGMLVAYFRMPAIVATIGTMSLFRGVAYGMLGDRALKHYPPAFAFFGQGYVFGALSFELLLFIIASLLFALYLHRTVFGRRIYAIGLNATAAEMSGVRVHRYQFWLFVASGVASAIASVLLTSRLGSTRPSIAQGLELDIISMVILGGVAVTGGRGTILGVVLAAVLTGLVIFGLGLINVPGIVMSLLMGALMIVVVGVPRVAQRLSQRRLSTQH
jgi:rhamnose transport system permease protein